MPVGWEPDDDGFRGYAFATEDNSTVVLMIKGTSIPIVGGGPTIEKDKLNDNLLFSCCRARVSRTWTPVCDCYRGGWKCNGECVEDALSRIYITISLLCILTRTPGWLVTPSEDRLLRFWGSRLVFLLWHSRVNYLLFSSNPIEFPPG